MPYYHQEQKTPKTERKKKEKEKFIASTVTNLNFPSYPFVAWNSNFFFLIVKVNYIKKRGLQNNKKQNDENNTSDIKALHPTKQSTKVSWNPIPKNSNSKECILKIGQG